MCSYTQAPTCFVAAKSFSFFFFSASYSSWICHYCASLRCFDARVPCCHSQNFGEPLGLNNINSATAFCNPFGNCASQLVTGTLNEGPTLFSEGGLAHSTPHRPTHASH